MTTLPHWAVMTLAWIGLVLSVLGLVNVACRRIPARIFTPWETSRPRLASFLRFNRAIGPDVDKGLRALPRILFGPSLPAVIGRLIATFLAPDPNAPGAQPAPAPSVAPPPPSGAAVTAPTTGGPTP